MTAPYSPRRNALRHVWTDAEIQQLRDLYPHTLTSALAEQMGISVNSIHNQCFKLGIKKAKVYLSAVSRAKNVGISTRFKPGQIPFNKGLKGWQAGGRAAETQFKKGTRPHTWLPIGSERTTKEGYLQRKLTDTGYPPRDWVPVHHIVWRAAGFDIPKGYRLTFKDGNKGKIELGNLELVSIADLLRRNSFHNYGPELAKLVQLRGAISRQINRREKSCQI